MLCIPIQAKSLKQLKASVQKAARYADTLEVWIDHLPLETEPRDIIRCSSKPLVIVNKPKREKGKWPGTEKQRIERLKAFAVPGVMALDVGIDTNPKLIKSLVKAKKRTKVIISYHNFERTPSESLLQQKMKRGFALGADIVKIATFAQKPTDNLTVLGLLKDARKPLAVMCMGKHGRISRMVGPALGSHITFVARDRKSASAPGQLTVQEYETVASLLKKT